MSAQYKAILWNRQKRIYDSVLAGGILLYLAVFIGSGAALHPAATIETLLIRAIGTASFVLLHIILCIGPLCRLSPRFLPLLYNRRHMGVAMFVLALAHSVFALIQFHAFGNINPLVSLLTSNSRYDSIAQFPFQQLGLAALIILFLMAATSHDFWLHLLRPRVWKRLHMLVYPAYALLVAHVLLGALQSERSLVLAVLLGCGAGVVVTLHILSGVRERPERVPQANDLLDAGDLSAIPDGRAVVVEGKAERIAVFRQGSKVSAISNVCRHQNGPLGEGKIIDGCVTCPWHGYQYDPETGCSPPPFTDKVPVYRTHVRNGRVFVEPSPVKASTAVESSAV